MKLTVLGNICNNGGSINEDITAVGDKYALVLDGSTGLRKNIIEADGSDAKWFVENFKEFIENNINSNRSLIEIIQCGIDKLSKLVKEYGIYNMDKVDEPSASIVVIRIVNDKLEVYSLGDCTTIIEKNNGDVFRIYDDSVTKLDNIVIEKMIEISKEKNISINQTKDLVREDLIKNRYKKNTEDGYWILGFEKSAITKGKYNVYNISDISRVCILSDGFADFYETMNISKDYLEFYNITKSKSCYDLLESLRQEQINDVKCEKHPRLKQMDDASLLLVKINEG